MKNYSTSDARNQFSDIVNSIAFGKERTILNRRGKDLVAMIPIEDLRHYEALEDKLDLIEAKLESLKKQKLKSWDQIKKESNL